MDKGSDSANSARTGSTLDRVGRRLAGRSPIADGLTIAAVVAVALSYIFGFWFATPGYIGHDLTLYQHEVNAWLSEAPMYPAFEVRGPFPIVDGVILYPPITIALFVLTLPLPLPLWWLIPISVVAIVIYRLHPRRRWLLAIACCLVYPISVGLVVSGNPDLWLAAALAVSVYWNPAAAFVLLKPSVFPFALMGWRKWEWWAIAGVFALVSLLLLPQTLDWLSVVRNRPRRPPVRADLLVPGCPAAHGSRPGLGGFGAGEQARICLRCGPGTAIAPAEVRTSDRGPQSISGRLDSPGWPTYRVERPRAHPGRLHCLKLRDVTEICLLHGCRGVNA